MSSVLVVVVLSRSWYIQRGKVVRVATPHIGVSLPVPRHCRLRSTVVETPCLQRLFPAETSRRFQLLLVLGGGTSLAHPHGRVGSVQGFGARSPPKPGYRKCTHVLSVYTVKPALGAAGSRKSVPIRPTGGLALSRRHHRIRRHRLGTPGPQPHPRNFAETDLIIPLRYPCPEVARRPLDSEHQSCEL